MHGREITFRTCSHAILAANWLAMTKVSKTVGFFYGFVNHGYASPLQLLFMFIDRGPLWTDSLLYIYELLVQLTVCYNCAIAPINLMLLTTTSIKDCCFCLVNISFDRLFYSNFCAKHLLLY
jgi:hypothetical protein